MKMESSSSRETDEGRGKMMSGNSGRWNPTKEQVSVLENLYNEGIKTPSAEEIQQITARLRVYGHIEGKNVFYWFQNHKARQRQKQKQETIANYFNRFLHHSSPNNPLFSPCPNGTLHDASMCAPYCIPQVQSQISYYSQHPNVLVPVGYTTNPPCVPTAICNVPLVYEGMHEQQRISDHHNNFTYSNQETLDLFPLHPTGILEAKSTPQVSSLSSVSASPHINHVDACPANQPFFDFFTSGRNP